MVFKSLCSKHFLTWLQLIQMPDNLDWNMRSEKCWSQLSMYLKIHMAFRRSDQLLVRSDNSFFKPALLSLETTTTSESSIDESIYRFL
jgi:hypothetical protein